MQLMKWLKNIVVISSILLLFVQTVFAEDPPSAQDAAKNQYERFRSLSGSPENLKQNFLDPTLGGSPLYTIDRSQSGNVVVGCPSNNVFLTIMITPRPTGDFDATIFQNNGGRFSISGVSGVCSNGFIICNPGTWINCTPYEFIGGNGNLNFIRLNGIGGMSHLSGCFCVNNSCGNGLVWHNLPYVLKIFGGAAAGALQKDDPRFAVSHVKIDGNTIQFFGQQEGGCSISEITNKGGALYPERYYGSPAMIQSGVESEVLAQSASPDSYYSLLSGLNQSQGNLRSCVIENLASSQYANCIYPNPTVSQNTEPFPECSGYSLETCGESCLRVNFRYKDQPHTSTYGVRFSDMFTITRVLLAVNGLDDDGGKKIYFNGNLVYQTGGGNSCFLGYSGDVTSYMGTNNTITIVGTQCGCGCWDNRNRCGTVSLTIEYKGQCPGHPELQCDGNIPPKCCVPYSVANDSCSNYELDPTCVLVDEKVDGVYTIRNQIKTGLTPIQRCENVCGDYVCPDFWRKERTYRCQSPDWDLSDAKQRLATVVPTSEYDGSKITFTDVRKENNSWNTYPNQIFYVQQGQQSEDCEKACKVKVVVNNTQVGLGAPVSQQNLTSGDYGVRYYRTCYNDQCPLKDGEVMEAPCQCVQNFPGAVTAMQAIRMAGQDIICSSGNIKTLPGASQ
jgi:hypothetical protein